MRGTPDSPSWQSKSNYAVKPPPHHMATPNIRHGMKNDGLDFKNYLFKTQELQNPDKISNYQSCLVKETLSNDFFTKV